MNESTAQQRHKPIAILLLACVVVVLFWQIMSNRSRRPFSPFQVVGEDFAGFLPRSDKWIVERKSITSSPNEPNLVAFRLTAKREDSRIGLFDHSGGGADDSGIGGLDDLAGTSNTEHRTSANQEAGITNHGTRTASVVFVRVAHGYNMPDCMKIKGYAVSLLADSECQVSGVKWEEDRAHSASNSGAGRVQVWKLKNSVGDASIWVTSMLRAGDFGGTDVDVRSMAFPRIGIPDDPAWKPKGLTWKSLKHPVRNLRWFFRAKWNNSRRDIWTFLKLRQPAWASDELLTLVSVVHLGPEEQDVVGCEKAVLAAHGWMHGELIRWNAARRTGKEGTATRLRPRNP